MNFEKYIEKAETLIEALPYIQDFRGSRIVVKVGGSVMESADALESLLSDVAFMSTVGMKIIIVHGGGKAISRACAAAGTKATFVKGLRVTDAPTMRIVEQVIKREINADIVKRLNTHRANARPLHGDWIFQAEKKVGVDPETGATLDWGFVGEPVAVNTLLISEMLDAGITPVVTPIGIDDEGQHYNINADTAAAALAKALRVRKLAFISDVPGVLANAEDPESLISSIFVGDIARLRDTGVIGGGMLPKLESCAEAIAAGVRKVHLIDGRMPHSLLLEMFTTKGVGTEIISDEQK